MDKKNHQKHFIEKIENIKDREYGDFKRKASQYLNQFEDKLEAPQLSSQFDEIKNHFLFVSREDDELEDIREELISWAQNLPLQ